MHLSPPHECCSGTVGRRWHYSCHRVFKDADEWTRKCHNQRHFPWYVLSNSQNVSNSVADVCCTQLYRYSSLINPWEDDKTHTKNDVSICFQTSRHSVRGKEVWDPNSVRADALDDSDGKDSAGRPLRYTHPSSHLSNEKNPGCLGYTWDYSTQLCRHWQETHWKGPYETSSEQKIALFFETDQNGWSKPSDADLYFNYHWEMIRMSGGGESL